MSIELETSERYGFQPAAKTIVVEFTGGLLDGEVLRGDSPDAIEAFRARGYYAVTRRGTVGRYTSLSYIHPDSEEESEPPRSHNYRVIDHSEGETEIVVRMKFVGCTRQ